MKQVGIKLKYLVAGIASRCVSESEVNLTFWSAYLTHSFDAIFPWCLLYGGWMDQKRYEQFLLRGRIRSPCQIMQRMFATPIV